MKLVIVICTFRRPASLTRALESLTRCDTPRQANWQVVVVDNGACDEARAVAASFRDRLPVEILAEPTTGLAHARNRAIGTVDCDYFIWTDDDVTVSKGWLLEYEAAFERHPRAAFFGGPIMPKFEGSPPEWLTSCLDEIQTAFAGRQFAKDAKTFDRHSPQLPFGANMAIRAGEQYRFRYDARLGRQPGPLILSGEESDCLERICSAGGSGIWIPNATVDHWIDADRQSVDYVRRYFYGMSFAIARTQLAADPGAVRGARRDLLRSEALYLWGRIARRPEIWVKALKRSAKLSGQLAARRATLGGGHPVRERHA